MSAIRIGVYVDCGNLWHSTARYAEDRGLSRDCRINYRSMMRHLRRVVAGDVTLQRAYVVESGNPAERRFWMVLKHLGFDVSPKKLVDGGNSCVDDLMDDASCDQDSWDAMVLVSGNGDFVELLDGARDSGKRVVVMSFRGSTARDLIESCNRFIALDDVQSQYGDLLG